MKKTQRKGELIAENEQLKGWNNSLEERLALTSSALKRAQDELNAEQDRNDMLEKRIFDLLAEREEKREEHEAAMSALRDIARYSRV